MAAAPGSVLALSGGVGGAKLALGLADVLPAGRLHVLVNTADDFRHFGLHISPDIDTLVYTLSGRASRALGWGLEHESWHTLAALEELGADTWFRLGDRDLATHLWRTQQLGSGVPLSAITATMARRLGIASHIHPMTDDPVRTIVRSDRGDLAFQHYFVRERCEPVVSGFHFEGIAAARPNAQVCELLDGGSCTTIVICPSNPYVSIDPILQLPGLWQTLRDHPAPVLVVSPIVAGQALKGPAAKMMAELGSSTSALEVARHYHRQYPGLVDHFVVDASDVTLVPAIRQLGINAVATSTVMRSMDDKRALARFTLDVEGS